MTKIKKLIMTLVALLAVTTSAWAQNKLKVLTVDDITVANGEETEIVIKLDYNASQNIAGVNFSLYLPNDLLLKGFDTKEAQDAGKASALKKACDLGDDGVWGEDVSTGWLTVKQKADGGLLFTLIDQDDHTPFESTHAMLVSVKVHAIAAIVNGEVIISTIGLQNENNESVEQGNLADVKFYVNKTAGTPDPSGTGTPVPVIPVEGKTNEWTLTVPAGNVTVNVDYYPGMLTLNHATNGTIAIEGLGATATQLTVPDAWIGDETNLSAADLEGFKELTVAEAKMWTGAPVEEKPLLIYGFNGDKVKFVYFTEEGAFPGEATYSRDDLYGNPWYYTTGFDMPEGFETDGLDFFVESGRQFTVIATPAEGYRLVSLSDGTNTYDVDADGKATITMPEGDVDLTLTATFSNEYDITFNAANDNTIEGGKATVKVDDADATVTDGKLQGVKYGQTVTITTKEGYKFKKVEVKKGAAPKIYTIKVNGIEKANDVSTFPYKFSHLDNTTMDGMEAQVVGGDGKVQVSVNEGEGRVDVTVTEPFDTDATVYVMMQGYTINEATWQFTVTCTANQ